MSQQCPTQTKIQAHVNSFTRRASVQQVFTYTLFFINLVTFLFLLTPSYRRGPLAIVLITIYAVTFITTFTLALIVSIIDPVDSEDRSQKRECFCSICSRSMQQLTKHCIHCNRCVQQFDHHCKWLNNCIGKRNYKYFCALLLSVIILNSSHIGLSAISVQSYFQGRPFFFWQNAQLAQTILVLIVLIQTIFSQLFLLLLFIFHSYLNMIGKTTYQFIVGSRDKVAPETPSALRFT